MHKDTQEELERLERALQEEEISDELIDEILSEDYSDCLEAPDGPEPEQFLNAANAYNADTLDVDLEEYAQQVDTGEEAPFPFPWVPLFTVILSLGAVGYMLYALIGSLL